MRHVVAPDDARGVREPVRVPFARRAEQERRGVDRAAGDDDDVRAVRLLDALAVDDDARDAPAGRVGLEPQHLRVRPQRDVRVLERGPHAEHVRVRLAVGEAREAVELGAPHAPPLLRVGLVEVDADRQVERLEPRALEVVVELLDPRLVRDGRVRERARAARLGGVLAGLAVDEVELLRLGVVRLEVVVGEGPLGEVPA